MKLWRKSSYILPPHTRPPMGTRVAWRKTGKCSILAILGPSIHSSELLLRGAYKMGSVFVIQLKLRKINNQKGFHFFGGILMLIHFSLFLRFFCIISFVQQTFRARTKNHFIYLM